MADDFSHDTVISRTARRLNTNDTRVREMLDVYADEYIKLARETENSAQLHPRPRVTEKAEAKSTSKANGKAAARPAKKAAPAKKAPAKATTPTGKPDTAQGESEGSGDLVSTSAPTGNTDTSAPAE